MAKKNFKFLTHESVSKQEKKQFSFIIKRAFLVYMTFQITHLQTSVLRMNKPNFCWLGIISFNFFCICLFLGKNGHKAEFHKQIFFPENFCFANSALNNI